MLIHRLSSVLRHSCTRNSRELGTLSGSVLRQPVVLPFLSRSPALLSHTPIRWTSTGAPDEKRRKKVYIAGRAVEEEHRKAGRWSALYAVLGMVILASGLTYASVPIYRRFCQATGGGGWGTAAMAKDQDKIERMKQIEKRLIRVEFRADKQARLQWEFKPLQDEVWVHPGETALIFYSARNPTTKPVVGISTYTVLPYEAGLYFAKIQCFCFEEQMLAPGEQVDMPVFFYIDPDFVDDPNLGEVDNVTLSYTFFESKDGVGLPVNPYQAEHKLLTPSSPKLHLNA